MAESAEGGSSSSHTQLPGAHFPVLHCPHKIRPHLFADYGSCQNICVKCNEEQTEVEVMAQKDHWNKQRAVFKAQMPALPLTKPNCGKSTDV